MIEMAKCRCGGWLSIVIQREYGATVETCTVCRYSAPLRSRAQLEEPIVLEAIRLGTTTPCRWPAGCEAFAAKGTDYCPAHCDERRKRLNREYAKAKYEIRVCPSIHRESA